MTYRPGYAEPSPTLISAFGLGRYGGWAPVGHPNAPASATNAGGTLYYVPLLVPTRCEVTKGWWINGASVSGNAGIGVYTSTLDGLPDKLLAQTASTTVSGISTVQVASLGSTVVLVPGLFFAAVVWSGTSEQFRTAVHAGQDAFCWFQEGSVTPGSLPSTATPAESVNVNLRVFGLVTNVNSVY